MINECPKCKERIGFWPLLYSRPSVKLECKFCGTNMFLTPLYKSLIFVYAALIQVLVFTVASAIVEAESYGKVFVSSMPFSLFFGIVIFVVSAKPKM